MRILHAFADHGVESEALASYGDVTRVGIDVRDNWASSPIQADGARLPFESGSFDLGLFHPKCAKYAQMTSVSGNPNSHQDQIPDARREAKRVCDDYILENVPRSPLDDPVLLDGKMFGLPIQYERAFETSFDVSQPPRQQPLPTETSTFFYSGKDTLWWRSVKGVTGDYPKEHTAKNCLPLVYVHWLIREYLEATGKAEGVTDYSNYDHRKTTERREAANESVTEY